MKDRENFDCFVFLIIKHNTYYINICRQKKNNRKLRKIFNKEIKFLNDI